MGVWQDWLTTVITWVHHLAFLSFGTQRNSSCVCCHQFRLQFCGQSRTPGFTLRVAEVLVLGSFKMPLGNVSPLPIPFRLPFHNSTNSNHSSCSFEYPKLHHTFHGISEILNHRMWKWDCSSSLPDKILYQLLPLCHMRLPSLTATQRHDNFLSINPTHINNELDCCRILF